MRRIVAFIKPNMLEDVVFALHHLAGFPGASFSEVHDIGAGLHGHSAHIDRSPLHGFAKSIRMEVICTDTQADQIAETIRTNAHTGLPDDGCIVVSEIASVIQIRTGEREPTV